MELGETVIGGTNSVYVIAEMSANHCGSKSKAKEIIHAAAESGADCIKIQTYTPDTQTIDSDKEYFKIEEGLWEGSNLYELYEKAYTPWEWQAELKEEAEEVGIDFFSTAYEETAVDFLEDLGVEFYKVASFGVTHIPFLEYLAEQGKPIIMSTGMATLGEIEEAVKTIKLTGNDQLALLKCSSAYPAVPEDMNLKTMNHLQETFGVPVGLSDHTLGSTTAIAAVARGASIVEKHFCLDRNDDSLDSDFSLEPDEFSDMVEDIRVTEKAVGEISYEISEREEQSRKFRRSIFAVKDIEKGEEFTEENIRVIRPEEGLKPKYYGEVVGKVASKDIEKDEPIRWYSIDVI